MSFVVSIMSTKKLKTLFENRTGDKITLKETDGDGDSYWYVGDVDIGGEHEITFNSDDSFIDYLVFVPPTTNKAQATVSISDCLRFRTVQILKRQDDEGKDVYTWHGAQLR